MVTSSLILEPRIYSKIRIRGSFFNYVKAHRLILGRRGGGGEEPFSHNVLLGVKIHLETCFKCSYLHLLLLKTVEQICVLSTDWWDRQGDVLSAVTRTYTCKNWSVY